MKNILLAGIAAAALMGAPALAADMPMKAPPPVFSWTGCYAGANIGGGWGRDHLVDAVGGGSFGTTHPSGFLGGGQIGCDYQSGAWVFGLEGMFDWSDLKNSVQDPIGAPGVMTTTKVDWLGTATARLGYAVDRTLVYVKGGAAWVHDKRNIFAPAIPANFPATDTEAGWVIGGGLEYAFAPSWSAKLEYNYIHLGNHNTTLVGIPNFPTATHEQIQSVLIGLNYRFGSR